MGAAATIKVESQRNAKAWADFRRACIAFYGRSFGDGVYEWIRRGEHDPVFACQKLLGIEPLPWWPLVWDAMREHRYIPGRMANSAAKTTFYTVTNMLAGFYRWFATPEWGRREYRILHLAPEEAQALESKIKTDAILGDNASEQMYRVPGGFDYRPCLLTPFFEEDKPDQIHQGYSILDGSGTITYRPTAFKAKGSDGTDPALVTWDELRHQRNFNEVLNTIIMSRFLRVPFARLLLLFTPIGASVELIAAYNRGLSGLPDDADWYSITIDDLRKANPSVSEETIARAHRNIDKRYLPMVLSGQTIQPEGAKFSTDSIEACTVGTTEPDWLSDLPGVQKRVTGRCEVCKKRLAGEDARHNNGEERHPMVGFLDPASSSAGADKIVGTLWDLHPPTWPRRWVDVVYIEELPAGTKIQRVALHVALMSMIAWCTVGFDQNSALGHNVDDNLADVSNAEEALGSKYLEPELRKRLLDLKLMPEPDIAPIEHNTKREKDVDLDYWQGLLDLEKVSLPFHFLTKQQHINYTRQDKNIQQDFVMVQVGAAWLAKGELPDIYAERSSRDKGGRKITREAGREDNYLGVGGDDPYFTLPSEIGDAFGAVDAYAAERKG